MSGTYDNASSNRGEIRHSLARNLLLWFLLLSLLPLSLVSWLGYRQAIDGLTDAAAHELAQSAYLKSEFIQNWFDYRILDLNSQAENHSNAELLSVLSNGFQASGQSLMEFVESDTWASLVDERQQNVVTFSHRYDYVYDVLLLDLDGNILFSEAHESELGTNLFTDIYSNTHFARTAENSLKTGQALFSDLERYAPSNGQLASFLTAPILDTQGNTLGVLAIQIKYDRVYQLMLGQGKKSSVTHYLVGADGLLRSPTNWSSPNDILAKSINTEQFKGWYKAHQGEHGRYIHNEQELASSYRGPTGEVVIGIHQTVRLPGTEWAILSEVEESEALAGALRLAQMTLLIFLLTGALVSGWAIYLARRITRPIIQLADASMAAAAGELNSPVKVEIENEIGELAKAFNHMLMMRRNNERALQDSSQETEQALNDLEEQKYALDQHAIVDICDLEGNITFVNDKFCELSGYGRDELMGQDHRLLNSGYHDADFFRNMYQTIASGKVWHAEICDRTKDGSLRWLNTTIVPFLGEDGKSESYISIRNDITSRKKFEQEFISAKDEAEAANKAKSEFLSSMSHELRTPLNAILGFTQIIQMEKDTSLSAVHQEYLNNISSAGQHLLALINDILDLARIESGQVSLVLEPVNLNTVIDETLTMIVPLAQKRNIQILDKRDKTIHSAVQATERGVKEIVLNLLSNAVKYNQHGGTITISNSEPHKGTLRLSISDTGLGLSETQQKAIFEPFNRLDADENTEGTGIGLTIAKDLIELMHGRIGIESEAGQGSTFFFDLPLSQLSENTLELTEQTNKETSLKIDANSKLPNGKKILVAEDNTFNQQLISIMLKKLGYLVEIAEDGEQALNHWENNHYDLILMDIRMPVMDGLQASRAIREREEEGKHIPIIALTADVIDSTQEVCLEAGMDDALQKPIDLISLQAALESRLQ